MELKNLPAIRETWVGSQGWEDPLEKGKATHSSIPTWRIPWTVWGRKESDTTKQLSLWGGAYWRLISSCQSKICVHGVECNPERALVLKSRYFWCRWSMDHSLRNTVPIEIWRIQYKRDIYIWIWHFCTAVLIYVLKFNPIRKPHPFLNWPFSWNRYHSLSGCWPKLLFQMNYWEKYNLISLIPVWDLVISK